MKRIYNLRIRVLVSPHERGFCAESLDIEGCVTAPTAQAALSGFVCGVNGILYDGEPILKERSIDLETRWANAIGEVATRGGESGYVVSISATY